MQMQGARGVCALRALVTQAIHCTLTKHVIFHAVCRGEPAFDSAQLNQAVIAANTSQSSSASCELAQQFVHDATAIVFALYTASHLPHIVEHVSISSEVTQNLYDIRNINAPINVMPHYPPPGHNRGQHRGVDIETQAPCRGI